MTTEPKAKSVDVLELLDYAVSQARIDSSGNSYSSWNSLDEAEYVEARAAIAELIVASNEVTSTFRAIGEDRTVITPAGLVKRAEEAMVRLAAAISTIRSTP